MDMSDTSNKMDQPEDPVLGAMPHKAPANPSGELKVVCSNCSYPVVEEYDDHGNMKGLREEAAPQDEEQALAEGWLDHGLGLYCPTCSLAVLEEQARDQEAEAESGVNGDIGEIIDAQVLRSFVPGVSEATVQEFVRTFRSERLSKCRVLAGLEPVPIYKPVPKDEAQAEEFLRVTAALDAAAKEKKRT